MGINAEVHVVPMEGWRRDMVWADTGRPWIPSSPNLPRIEGVQVYPGMVLVEGTNLSEGRGTTTPFEVVGAPFIDPFALVDTLLEWDLPGIVFRPITFQPTFQKWHDQNCGGVYLHVMDEQAFEPYRTAVVLLACIRQLWPNDFRWLQPPYEYEYEKMPIDILSGSPQLREALESDPTRPAVGALAGLDADEWWAEAGECLLYP